MFWLRIIIRAEMLEGACGLPPRFSKCKIYRKLIYKAHAQIVQLHTIY